MHPYAHLCAAGCVSILSVPVFPQLHYFWNVSKLEQLMKNSCLSSWKVVRHSWIFIVVRKVLNLFSLPIAFLASNELRWLNIAYFCRPSWGYGLMCLTLPRFIWQINLKWDKESSKMVYAIREKYESILRRYENIMKDLCVYLIKLCPRVCSRMWHNRVVSANYLRRLHQSSRYVHWWQKRLPWE